MFKLQRFSEAAVECDRLVRLQPLRIVHYENLALSHLLAGQQILKSSPREAEKHFLEVLTVESKIQQARAKLSKWSYVKQQIPSNLKVNDRIKSYMGQAQIYLREMEGD